jgi:hypothetical protein
MPNLQEFVEGVFAIFIVILLGTFLYPVLNQLSPLWGLFFAFSIFLIVIAAILSLFRRD